MVKKGVLLVNLGTPDSPSVKDVRKYLREFLMDKYVIDLPYFFRWLLVNLYIAPFRAPNSALDYKKLWTKDGSPLLHFGNRITQLLQEKMGNGHTIYFAMRYQNPSIKGVIKSIKADAIDDLTVIPLYPQYASSSSKSSIEKVKLELSRINYHPKVRYVEQFVSNDKFIATFAKKGSHYWKTGQFQKVVFSFHGIPERHILKDSSNGYCQLNDKCCNQYHEKNLLCYRAQCYHTAWQIAEKMKLKESDYVVAFQSRLETRVRDPWLKPYSDFVVADLAKSGVKNVLCFSPSFIADCLETTIEVGEEFKDIFIENGGENWQLVESLNDDPNWIESLEDIILNAK